MPQRVEVCLNCVEIAITCLRVRSLKLKLALPLGQIVLEKGGFTEMLGCRKDAFEKTIAQLGLILSGMRGSFTVERAQLLAYRLDCMRVHPDIVEDADGVPLHIHLSEA